MARTHTPRVASEDGNPPRGALLLRKTFFSSEGKILQANLYLDLARYLLRVHRPIIPKRDMNLIQLLEIAIRRQKMKLASAKCDRWFGLGTFHSAMQYKHIARKAYSLVKGASDRRDADDETIIFERERAENGTDAGLDWGFSLEEATRNTEDEIVRLSSHISNDSSTSSTSPSELFDHLSGSSDSLDSGSGDSQHASLFCII